MLSGKPSLGLHQGGFVYKRFWLGRTAPRGLEQAKHGFASMQQAKTLSRRSPSWGSYLAVTLPLAGKSSFALSRGHLEPLEQGLACHVGRSEVWGASQFEGPAASGQVVHQPTQLEVLWRTCLFFPLFFKLKAMEGDGLWKNNNQGPKHNKP